MPKRDIYDVRFVTKDGPDGYFAKLSQPEIIQVKDMLGEYAGAGEITEPEVRLIDESISLSMEQLKSTLGERFGILEKGRPDVSRVDVRLDDETEKMVRDLLVTAFEGGSNYWYRIDGKKLPPGTAMADFKQGGRMQPSGDYYHWSQLIPTIPGGQLIIRDTEGDEAHVLDLPAIRKGLMLMKQKFPKHYARALDESYDAGDADVFLQLSLFDDVIFG